MFGYVKGLGLVGVENSQPTTEKITHHFNFSPVIENLLVVFKTLGLVLLWGVDRLGASDVDKVGVQGVRKGSETQLFECPVQLADEFELLFSHWDEVDEPLWRISVWIWG